MSLLDETLTKIERSSRAHAQQMRHYLGQLAMPQGALGDMEDLLQRLAAIYRQVPFSLQEKVLVMSTADHGVAAQGVSKYPQITGSIVKTALNGGAAINAFCRTADCDLKIVDAGLLAKISHRDLIDLSCGPGTADFSQGPAMTSLACRQAVGNGLKLAKELSARYQILALGEMGIGNTTSAAALATVFCGVSARKMTGRGTGIDDVTLRRKVTCIEQSIKLNNASSAEPLEVLAKLGGYEIATMVGLILGWSSLKKAVVLDGFISGSAALCAVALAPAAKDYLIAGHESAEQGHKVILEFLSLNPLLSMDMRLGEGVGAALALQAVGTASELCRSMMSLNDALKL